MDKNYNYNFENRSVVRSIMGLGNVEMASCKKADLNKTKVTNGRFYHTTDTNEFFFDWDGKRNPLNVLGSDQNIKNEINKIKNEVSKLNPENITKLENKVTTAASQAQAAATKAQAAANAVNSKASVDYVDQKIAAVKSIKTVTTTATGYKIVLTDGTILEVKNGDKGDRGIQGETGAAGKDGKDGVDGKDFTYDMFTPEQLEALKGENGVDGKDGADGKDFTYDMFTTEQLEALKGADGKDGVDGKDFTYDMFTTEQLEALKGADGKDGSVVTIDEITHEWMIDGVTTGVKAIADGLTQDDKDKINSIPDDLTTGEFPTESNWENEDASKEGLATVQDVMDYVNLLFEKKKLDEPISAINCVYIAGYALDGVKTDITSLNPFELNDDGDTIIEVLTSDEINTFDPETYDSLEPIRMVVDIPVGYSLKEIYLWNPISNGGEYQKTSLIVNPRVSTKTYNGITYNSYVRGGDASAAYGASQYKIIIKKD